VLGEAVGKAMKDLNESMGVVLEMQQFVEKYEPSGI
jgi:hypothetical protein